MRGRELGSRRRESWEGELREEGVGEGSWGGGGGGGDGVRDFGKERFWGGEFFGRGEMLEKGEMLEWEGEMLGAGGGEMLGEEEGCGGRMWECLEGDSVSERERRVLMERVSEKERVLERFLEIFSR